MKRIKPKLLFNTIMVDSTRDQVEMILYLRCRNIIVNSDGLYSLMDLWRLVRQGFLVL